MPDFRRLIVTEFDRVLHAATTPNDPFDETHIPDPPLSGNIKWLAWCVYAPAYRVAVFSARSCSEAGIKAMQNWLTENGLDQGVVDQIEWPQCKPPDAVMFVDARAYQYRGVPPTAAEMDTFKPWGSP
jgi:hypothetical protein